MTLTTPIYPGATIGVLGGGQLGRMFAQAAQSLGYQVAVLDPDPNSPTGQIAHHHLCAEYTDLSALDKLASLCAAVTTEFENVPADSLLYLAKKTRVAPHAKSVALAQDRTVEKAFFAEVGLDVAPWIKIESLDEAANAWNALGLAEGHSAIIKTARMGYDGKGQVVCHQSSDVIDAFKNLKQVVCVLEKRVDLRTEISVVLTRAENGESRCFPVAENHHENGILATTTVPALIDNETNSKALSMATALAEQLEYQGVMALELFITEQNEVLANEMAPRPHNSGHFTLDATACSQFEQQVRALCCLPLADTALLSPVVMENLLGDRWSEGEPNWSETLQQAGAKLHLYGKSEARSGRKMSHINWLKLQK